MPRNFTIVGVYEPVKGKEQDTEEFYGELQQSMDKIPKKENIILAGDFKWKDRQSTNPRMYRNIWRTSNKLQWSSIERFLRI